MCACFGRSPALAAAWLHLSQPTISAQIKALEKNLEFPLATLADKNFADKNSHTQWATLPKNPRRLC
ncbi:MAG: LysR family transcriptional regulator [Verrucomicrobiaceae bacterium]|nr:LysR family transcriptional regulator [Verrucomicrobiaceae bacterium]